MFCTLHPCSAAKPGLCITVVVYWINVKLVDYSTYFWCRFQQAVGEKKWAVSGWGYLSKITDWEKWMTLQGITNISIWLQFKVYLWVNSGACGWKEGGGNTIERIDGNAGGMDFILQVICILKRCFNQEMRVFMNFTDHISSCWAFMKKVELERHQNKLERFWTESSGLL